MWQGFKNSGRNNVTVIESAIPSHRPEASSAGGPSTNTECTHRQPTAPHRSSVKWNPFELRLDDVVHGSLPSFVDMKPHVLYVPLNPKYPFFDSMYKTKAGELVGLQVTRQKKISKKCTLSALQRCLDDIKLPDDKIPFVRVVLIPLPCNADAANLVLEPVLEPVTAKAEKKLEEDRLQLLLQVLDKYEVWQVPEKYQREYIPEYI